MEDKWKRVKAGRTEIWGVFSVSKDSFYKHWYINRKKKKKAYFKEVANPKSLEKKIAESKH